MRRGFLAVLLLSLVLPAFSGCTACCELVAEMLFPGSTLTWEEKAHIDQQNANFAAREEAESHRERHPLD